MARAKQPLPSAVPGSTVNVSVIVVPLGPLRYQIPSQQATFDFEFLTRVFSNAFAEAAALVLSKQFPMHSRHYNDAKLQALNDLLEHTRERRGLARQIKAGSSSGRIRMSDDLTLAIKAWFATRKREYYPQRATTLAEKLNALRAAFRPLVGAGLVGKIEFPKMPRNYHVHGGHRPSLVESGKRDVFCGEIVAELHKLASAMGIELSPDAASYVAGIADAVPTTALPSEEQFRTAFQRINWQRLLTIRDVAEQALHSAVELFEHGQDLLARASPGVTEQIQSALKQCRDSGYAALDAVFPSGDAIKATANLLKFSDEAFAGVVPKPKEFRKYCAGTYMMHLFRRLGGRRRLRSMLAGDPNGIAGAALIYLVDSGDNVSSALALSPRCIEPTDDPNKVRIVSYKARSDWQPVVDTFDISDTSVQISVPQALELVLRMTSRTRERHPAFADTLLMFHWFDEPSAASFEFLSGRLHYLVRDSGNVFTKELLPGSIRQSFLLDRTLIADGKIRAAEILAKHNSKNGNSTPIYTARWPIKLLYGAKIRTFQRILETDIVFNGLQMGEALGLTAAEAEKLLKSAKRTGNGLRCRDSTAGEGPTSAQGQDCEDAGASCLDCKMRLIVVDEETVADALRTKERLEAQMEQFEAEAPARWESEMLPELAFVTAFVEKLRRTAHAALLRRVEANLAKKNRQENKDNK